MPLNPRWTRTPLLAGLFVILALPAQAEPTTDAETLSPYFFVEGDPTIDRLPLAKTDVKVEVAGVIANVKVTQTYKNQGSRATSLKWSCAIPSFSDRQTASTRSSTPPWWGRATRVSVTPPRTRRTAG